MLIFNYFKDGFFVESCALVYTTVPKSIVAVNFGGEFNNRVKNMLSLLSSKVKKATMSRLLVFHSEKKSFMQRFQKVGLKKVLLRLCVQLYIP